MSNILGLVVRFGKRTALWHLCSWKAIGEEDDGRIWIEYYIFFISAFSCIIWGCIVPRFNTSPLPFAKKVIFKFFLLIFRAFREWFKNIIWWLTFLTGAGDNLNGFDN